VNKDGGSDSASGVGFVTPKAPVETVLLSESGALVVQTTGTDGKTTVRAAVDVNVSDNGEVVFTEVQQQAFDTVALRVSSITTGADNDISIGIADSNAEPGQRYSGALADGTALPDWIIIDPKTGDVSLRSPGDVKELTLRIQAVGSDGQTRILEIKLNIEELQRNQATGSAEQPAADVAATGFVPLTEQLAAEVDTIEGYGHRLLTMLTAV
ncbi:MAG: hypothetical protein R3311_13610, partial [Oceanisphaera sp.]|nr:hypothetical protein [Oceanisphaera sp.]